MESATVEILKADNNCLLAPAEDCPLNFSAWLSGYPDGRNVSHDGRWEQEGMPPIIPIITAVYSVVFVVGLFGNCLVMYVIVR